MSENGSMPAPSRFRTPEDADRFLKAYDITLTLWNVPHQPIDIKTSFGLTRVNAAGAPNLPPLVLIHGAQIGSPVWYPNVAALSQHFRIYAPDVVDQAGLSIPTRRLKTAQDCSDWLTEVLDKLQLEQVFLAGHSQGGFQALNMALAAPQRVKKLVLLSPSGSLGPTRAQLLFKMLPVFISPTRGNFYKAFQAMMNTPVGTQHPLAEQFMIGAQGFKPGELSLGVVSVFKDDVLRRLGMPTLLLFGEEDITCHPKKELERARRLIPHLKGEIVPGGHLFTLDSAELVNQKMLEFLRG